MKKHSKIINLVILCFVLVGSEFSLMAQTDEQKERFHEEKIKFYNEKLNLSEAEAKLFWPVHEDFHNRSRKINEDERSLLNYYSCNSDAMTDAEVDESIKKFQDLQKKRLYLSEEYHANFVKIIGKRKTMKMYSLDREFRMYILKKFRTRGPGGDNGNDRGHNR